jgi:hypothetical protein
VQNEIRKEIALNFFTTSFIPSHFKTVLGTEGWESNLAVTRRVPAILVYWGSKGMPRKFLNSKTALCVIFKIYKIILLGLVFISFPNRGVHAASSCTLKYIAENCRHDYRSVLFCRHCP